MAINKDISQIPGTPSDKDRLNALRSALDASISKNPENSKDLAGLRQEVVGLISKEQEANPLNFQESISNLETKVREKLAEIEHAKAKTLSALDELKRGVNNQQSLPQEMQNIDFVQAAKAGKEAAQGNVDEMMDPAENFYNKFPLFGKLFSYLSGKSKES